MPPRKKPVGGSAVSPGLAIISRGMNQQRNPQPLPKQARISSSTARIMSPNNPVNARISPAIDGDLNKNIVQEPKSSKKQKNLAQKAVEDEKLPKEREEVDEEQENMGVAETYSEYVPTKLKWGRKHPDPVVETSTLASVLPPDITYEIAIPKETLDAGLLSALQLEAIVYACQRHDIILPDKIRAGFFIGDGPGVGKGRTAAGIVWENYLRGRKKALWVSVSSDLKHDAQRDFKEIGATQIQVIKI